MTDWVDFLSTTDIFRNVSLPALGELAARLLILEFAPGEVLMREGDPGDCMYVVLAGQVCVVGVGAHNEEKVLAEMGPGATVGELALWTGDRRSATVRTMSAARLAKLTREDFDRFAEMHPAEVQAVDRNVASRLRHSQLGSALHLSGLFDELDEAALRDLEAELEPILVPGGTTLFRQGDAGDALYFVVSGLLQVQVEHAGQPPRVINQLGRGETFGEMAVLENKPRSATILALRDSEVARLSREAFQRLLGKRPGVVLPVVTRKLMARLREQIEGVAHGAGSPAAFAVWPASADVPLDAFCARLADALATHGATLHLNSVRVDAYMGRSGAAQTTENQAGHGRIVELLGKLEAEHRYLIYQADASESPWNDRCLRQCDHILIVGDAAADSRPGPAELRVARVLQERTAAAGSLVLLHRDAGREPEGTSAWLSARNMERHYHVRMDSLPDYGRLARYLTRRAVGLVLGGGAARGFAHAGVIRALREAGVPIDLVGGTSAGASMSVTCGLEYDYKAMIDDTVAGWRALLSDRTIPLVSILSGFQAERYLRKVLGDRDLEDIWIPCFCVSANLTRARVHVHRRGSVVRSVLASGRMPAILPPVLWDGDLLVDGGIINNVPVDVMRGYSECGTVIACDVSPAYEPPNISAYGDGISGWQALRQFMRPKPQRERYPGMFSVLLRSMQFGGAAYQDRVIGAADLYLTPPTAQFTMSDYKRAHEIAEAAYPYACRMIAEWLASSTGLQSVTGPRPQGSGVPQAPRFRPEAAAP